jgi:hypothetical protein
MVKFELEKTGEEAVMTYFKVLSQQLPQGTEENHKILRIVSYQAKIQVLDFLLI